MRNTLTLLLILLCAGCASNEIQKNINPHQLSLHQLPKKDLTAKLVQLQSDYDKIQFQGSRKKQDLALILGYLYFKQDNIEKSKPYFDFLLTKRSYGLREYVLFYLAQIYIHQKDCRKATVYRTTLSKNYHRSPVNSRLESLYDNDCKKKVDLKKLSKKKRRAKIRQNLYEAALDAYEEKDYKLSLELFTKYLNRASPDHANVYDTLKKLNIIYKRMDEKNKRLKVLWALAKYEKEDKKFPYSPKWIYEIARYYWNHNNQKLTKVYLWKLIRWPHHSYVGRAYYILGKLSAESFYYKSASWYMDQASKHANEPTLQEEIDYLKGWYAYKAKQFKSASLHFESFRDEHPKADYFLTASYWLGRSYERLKQKENATAVYEDIISKKPFSYYAIRSLNRLKDKKESQKLSLKNTYSLPISFLSYVDQKHLSKSERLVHLGLGEDGIFELKETASLTSVKKMPWELQYYIAALYRSGGDYVSSFIILNRLHQSHNKLMPDEHILMLYPKRYWQLIQKYSKKYHVDPYLILAIMRQESAFDPLAISSADAYGLLQIRPILARAMAKEINSPLRDKEDLLTPEINLKYCVYFFSTLLKKYNNNLVLSLAAYNSNPRAVKRWQKKYWTKDIEEFIEEIPYKETRSYVKLILRNYTNNHLIHEGKFKVF